MDLTFTIPAPVLWMLAGVVVWFWGRLVVGLGAALYAGFLLGGRTEWAPVLLLAALIGVPAGFALYRFS